MLLPSKIQIEEFISMFSDFGTLLHQHYHNLYVPGILHLHYIATGLYTDIHLLDLYRTDTSKRSVSVLPLIPISSEPAENGVTLTDISDTDSLATSNTDLNNSSVVSDKSEEELRKCLEAEPFWQAISQMRNRQYSNVVELTSQAIDTGTLIHLYIYN